MSITENTASVAYRIETERTDSVQLSGDRKASKADTLETTHLRVCNLLSRWTRSGLELQLANHLSYLAAGGIDSWIASSLPPDSLVPQVPEKVILRSFTGAAGHWQLATWLARELIETGTDLLHARGLWMLPDALRAAQAAGDLPVVCSFHGFDEASLRASRWRRRRWRSALRQCSAIVTVSQATREALVNTLGLYRDQVEVIHNGVDAEYFRPADDPQSARTCLGFDGGGRTLLCVGTLRPIKGYDVLIDALSTDLPAGDLRLVFVGRDELDGALQQLAAKKLVNVNVHFAGNVRDVRPYYAAADALIAPSRSEGLSNSILEAMACGLPVVASAVGGTPELVVDGRTGWLVPPENPLALARGIAELLGDVEEARRRGLIGRQLVVQRFGITRAAERYHQLYKRVANTQSTVNQTDRYRLYKKS